MKNAITLDHRDGHRRDEVVLTKIELGDSRSGDR
jgi:hypothetical protein